MAGPLAVLLARIGSGMAARTAAARQGVGRMGQWATSRQAARQAATPAAERGSGRMAQWANARQARREAAEEAARRLQTPVAEQTAGMTLQQRVERLKSQSRLLSPREAAIPLAKDPSQVGIQERVEQSEAAEETQRRQQVREEEATQEQKGFKWKLAKQFTGLGMLAALLGIGFKKLGDVTEKLASTMLERQRELARFSPQIARGLMRLERQQLGLKIGRAAATGTSTGQLADTLGRLRADMEPLRRTFITVGNHLAILVAQGGSILAWLAKKHPAVAALQKWAEKSEEELRKQRIPIANFADAISRGQMGPNLFAGRGGDAPEEAGIARGFGRFNREQ